MRALLVLGLVLALARPAPAQPAVTYTTIVQDLRDREYAPVRKNLLAAAERVPADKFAWRPVAGARTFAEELQHVADVNNRLCGIASGAAARARGASGGRGETPPSPAAAAAGQRPASNSPSAASPAAPATKSETVANLRRSFDLCDAVLAQVDDATLLAPSGGGFLIASRLIAMVGHISQMYGRVALELRLNGLVPPSSDP